jgi:23S rRNA pseudouridine2605 synthase
MPRIMALVRLQKVLAQAGVASRRKAEELIEAGRVRVNGVIVTELGTKVDERRDKIEVNGRRVVAEKPAYYVVHKPRGMVTTMDDPEGRPSINEILERIPERVFPVGRLDFHTSGVILATNDGEMAEALSRPRSRVPKTYVAKFTGAVTEETLQALRNGVTLDDGYVTKPANVFVERVEDQVTWLNITITEGKNRQIHRMAEALGHQVFRLVRLEFAGVTAEGLRPGEFRPLGGRELDQLKKHYLNPHKRAKTEQKEARDRGDAPTPARRVPTRKTGSPRSRDTKAERPPRKA